MNNHIIFLWTGLFITVLCTGCGGQKLPSDMPKLHPTVITVIQGGNPLPDALVTMVNVDATILWSCIARTDSSGTATMQTNGMYVGAPAGTYKATVTKQEVVRDGGDPYAGAPDPAVDQEAYQGWLMKNEARIAAAERQQPVVNDLVDPKFGRTDTTTLEIPITAGRNNHTLDVGAAVREVNKERPQ